MDGSASLGESGDYVIRARCWARPPPSLPFPTPNPTASQPEIAVRSRGGSLVRCGGDRFAPADRVSVGRGCDRTRDGSRSGVNKSQIKLNYKMQNEDDDTTVCKTGK